MSQRFCSFVTTFHMTHCASCKLYIFVCVHTFCIASGHLVGIIPSGKLGFCMKYVAHDFSSLNLVLTSLI